MHLNMTPEQEELVSDGKTHNYRPETDGAGRIRLVVDDLPGPWVSERSLQPFRVIPVDPLARIATLEAREAKVREWMEGMQRDADDERNGWANMVATRTIARELRAILDGKVASPVPVLPTITLDATKAGTIAEEAPERHWMVMQDPDGSWAAWSCGAHEGYRLHNDKCGLTREQAEDEGRASGLRPFDGKVTP